MFQKSYGHPALEKLKFWRLKSGCEVDFVAEGEALTPIEVKYASMDSPRIPSGLRSFIRSYSPSRAVVITRDYLGEAEFNGCRVIFVPVYLIS